MNEIEETMLDVLEEIKKAERRKRAVIIGAFFSTPMEFDTVFYSFVSMFDWRNCAIMIFVDFNLYQWNVLPMLYVERI